MNYNPIDGCIIFSRKSGGRIGTIFLHNGSDAFFEINPESNSGCYVGLFLSELKKYIESSKKELAVNLLQDNLLSYLASFWGFFFFRKK